MRNNLDRCPAFRNCAHGTLNCSCCPKYRPAVSVPSSPEFTRVPHWHESGSEGDYAFMVVAEEEVARRPIRRWRTLSEKRRIAELTFEPGASVAVVARANGVNANQVFKWRRLLQRGELNEPAPAPTSLLPVMLSVASETADDRGTVDLKGSSLRGVARFTSRFQARP
jgi:transposase-like protein